MTEPTHSPLDAHGRRQGSGAAVLQRECVSLSARLAL
jgi:hypothetical protein